MMFFFTYDVYQINENIEKNKKEEEQQECFVCYEINIDGTTPVKLEEQKYCLKNCKCIGFIHKKCLEKWFIRTNKCPICRESITLVKNISIINTFFLSFYVFYIFIKKKIYRITQVILIVAIFYFIIDSYYYILINKLMKIDSYDYNSYYNYNNYYVENFENSKMDESKVTQIIIPNKGYFIDNKYEMKPSFDEILYFNISSIN